MSWIKIGKHEFNVEAIKDMSESQFKKLYSHLGDNASLIYYKINVKKKPKKKKDNK